MRKRFSLVPYGPPPTSIDGIDGEIDCHFGLVDIVYRITGEIGSISLPGPMAAPVRRDGLWQETCCECFLQVAGRKDYFEVNLSPNGDWNVYHFERYRQEMTREPQVTAVLSELCIERERAIVRCRLSVADCLGESAALRVGISCVVAHRGGATSYWALVHPAEKPDFHDSRSFIVNL